MNSIECSVARDLMPLAIDQIASEESRTLVEAHVASCSACAQVYTDMQAKTPENKDVAEDVSFAAAMRQLRRTVGWRRIKVIVLSAVITLLLMAAGIWGNQFFFVEYNRDMPLDWYNMTLSRTKDGAGLVTVDYNKGYGGSYALYADPSSGLLVIGSKCPLVAPGLDGSQKVLILIGRPGIRWKDGVGFVFAAGDSGENATDMVVKEIRMGTMENYKVLYQQGGEVPLCSDKLETIAELEKKYADAQKAADDISMDLAALYGSISPD